jgi:hypothetical protein
MSRAELQIFASSLGDAYLKMFASFRDRMQDDAAAAGHGDVSDTDTDPMAVASAAAAHFEEPMMTELGTSLFQHFSLDAKNKLADELARRPDDQFFENILGGDDDND